MNTVLMDNETHNSTISVSLDSNNSNAAVVEDLNKRLSGSKLSTPLTPAEEKTEPLKNNTNVHQSVVKEESKESGLTPDKASVSGSQNDVISPPPTDPPSESINSLYDSKEDTAQQGNSGRRMAVTSSPTRMAPHSFIREKRLKLYRRLCNRLIDPERGLTFKTRKKMFKNYPSCVPGDELSNWIFNRCHYMIKEEAVNTVQTMIWDGFIIPTSEDSFKFTENGLYCLQTPEYWPTSGVDATDEEYAMHLLTIKGCTFKETLLQEFELTRLEKFRETFGKNWEKMKAVAAKRVDDLSKMEKSARKLALLQDCSYWNLHRPKDPKSIVQVDIEAEHKGQHLNEDEFLAGKSAESVLAFYERRLEMLKDSLNRTRVKMTVATNGLINRCEVYARFDPIQSPGLKFNPYVDDPASWLPENENEVTVHYTRIWQLSLKDLLNDSRGLKRFEQFLKTEFSSENLYFYLECLELDRTPNSERFYHKAKQMYREFIQKHAQKEINIESNVRTAIDRKFESKNSQDVDYAVFAEAAKHIFHLMMKDSYPRFLASKFSAVNVE